MYKSPCHVISALARLFKEIATLSQYLLCLQQLKSFSVASQVVSLSNDLAQTRTDYARLKEMYDALQPHYDHVAQQLDQVR